MLCIETSTTFGSLQKFVGAPREFKGALGFHHPLISSPVKEFKWSIPSNTKQYLAFFLMKHYIQVTELCKWGPMQEYRGRDLREIKAAFKDEIALFLRWSVCVKESIDNACNKPIFLIHNLDFGTGCQNGQYASSGK